jgi:hypothetical protein
METSWLTATCTPSKITSTYSYIVRGVAHNCDTDKTYGSVMKDPDDGGSTYLWNLGLLQQDSLINVQYSVRA